METERQSLPDTGGHFGAYGGKFVPETLIPALTEFERVYKEAVEDPKFHERLNRLMKDYVGRPTPLYHAERLSEHLGGPKIYLKREDLCHTGAHKINNALGQVLLAIRMGKKRIIAETGAGQHGVATATVAARFGLKCVIYMGEVDMKRQALNVYRMRLLGSEVRPVYAGQRTLKEAVSEAIRDWVANSRDSHYILGSALGPHPFPMIVRDFQSVVGREARGQFLEAEGKLPDMLVACVGGGSNSIGLFHPFLKDDPVRMVGVEAGGRGTALGEHAARFSGGRLGILQGTRTFVLQDDDGQIALTHSISAGLDYAAVGPEHAYLHETGRVKYCSVNDDETIEAFKLMNRLEGILPALESSHAIAWIVRELAGKEKGKCVIASLSGRGDKDINQLMDEAPKALTPELGEVPSLPKSRLDECEWRDGLLIRSPNWLGDAIMTLPSMMQLKELLPKNCGLFVVCPKGLAPIFNAVEGVDWVLPLHDAHSFMSLSELGSVRRLQPGACVVYNNSLRDVISLKLAGVPKIFGASARFRDILLTASYEFPKRQDRALNKPHHAAKYLAMAYALGAPKWKGQFPIFKKTLEPELISDSLKAALESPRLLAVAGGAAYGEAKRWPSDRFSKLCQSWIDEGGSVVAVGSPAEREIASEIVKGLPESKAFNMAGSTKLEELIEILRRSAACVANDSGVMHLAAALGTPGVAVFGSTDPIATSPLSSKWRMVFGKRECSPCFKRVCPKGTKECFDAITPELAFSILKSLLEELPNEERTP